MTRRAGVPRTARAFGQEVDEGLQAEGKLTALSVTQNIVGTKYLRTGVTGTYPTDSTSIWAGGGMAGSHTFKRAS